jgi:hypothetical protein
VRWADLPREDPARLDLELAKAGASREDLVKDVQDVPELRDVCDRLANIRSQRESEEALLRLALDWFGDQQHEQPAERRLWADVWFDDGPVSQYRTSDWGRLPRLDNEPDEAEPTPETNDPPGLRRTPGPPAEFHEREAIAAALDTLHRTRSVTEAMEASGLNNKDVLRAEKIKRRQLFRLDGTELWVHPEKVRQRGGLVALRVMRVDADGPKWVDPLP